MTENEDFDYSIDIYIYYFLYANLKSLFNVYIIMILIYGYDNFIFSIAMFLMIIVTLAILLTFVYSPYFYHNIKNIIIYQ
jgi:hypothetical protein